MSHLPAPAAQSYGWFDFRGGPVRAVVFGLCGTVALVAAGVVRAHGGGSMCLANLSPMKPLLAYAFIAFFLSAIPALLSLGLTARSALLDWVCGMTSLGGRLTTLFRRVVLWFAADVVLVLLVFALARSVVRLDAVIGVTVLLVAALHAVVALVRPAAALVGSRSALVSPPGARARGLFAFVFSQKTMQGVFEPLLGDIQAEWLGHVVEGRHWHARMTRLRGYVELGTAIAANGGASFVDLVVKIYKLK